jgi:bla regulator protein blaR1
MAACLLQALTVVNAQITSGDPAFEVASIKPNKSGDIRMGIGFTPGDRLDATNETLLDVLRFAYQIQNFQIVGGPAWIGTERFDITARPARVYPPGPNGPAPELLQMLRTLLADRFKLRTHSESRNLPTYSLMLANNGSQLHSVDVDCAKLLADRTRSGPPPPPPTRGAFQARQLPPCAMLFGPGRLVGTAMSMPELTRALMPIVGRMITDRTGLAGRFEISLEFTPDQAPLAGSPMPPADPNGPRIFTALQEQLGLKLESTRGAVDVLVIDHVEQPMPD